MRPYQAYVENDCRRRPSLDGLRQFLSNPVSGNQACRITSLDFYRNSQKPQKTALDLRTLRSYLDVHDSDSSAGCERSNPFAGEITESQHVNGRIFIIEDLTKDIIELLGSALVIDPMFFAAHVHAAGDESQNQTPDRSMLPSQLKRRNFINILYHRTIQFDENVSLPYNTLRRYTNVPRKVVVLPISEDRHVGLVQHCTSVLCVTHKRLWLGIVLVDPPLGHPAGDDFFYRLEQGGSLIPIRLASKFFQGGYEDSFTAPPARSFDLAQLPYSNRTGLLDDLVCYWSSDDAKPFEIHSGDLGSLSYYPLQIVAGEWVKYLGVMYRAIKQYEYSTAIKNTKHELDKLNADMGALQRWRRRSMSSTHKIQTVLRMLRNNMAETPASRVSFLVEDYEYIASRIEEFGNRLERMLPVVTSLVQIIDSRRSFDETANVSRLTAMALVFVPLTYISSLFSMNSKLGPGGPLFWVYFAVAIPITIVVYLIARPPAGLLRLLFGRACRIPVGLYDRRGKMDV
ncbi:hypothetical protein BCR34DRAFT_605646 [Clohesyomyces aquaticus]|uniref:Cora-like Mg2+ transporter protein-domain-containing protein n=1 Tax=Clohesyomyces aquaticus TaxID=1231657 RepID=A0A1Y1YXK2_9PLEO|nr:hypothetical protein BCR34DRAFT_605646 [Clohesyomyces aquaticus]